MKGDIPGRLVLFRPVRVSREAVNEIQATPDNRSRFTNPAALAGPVQPLAVVLLCPEFLKGQGVASH